MKNINLRIFQKVTCPFQIDNFLSFHMPIRKGVFFMTFKHKFLYTENQRHHYQRYGKNIYITAYRRKHSC